METPKILPRLQKYIADDLAERGARVQDTHNLVGPPFAGNINLTWRGKRFRVHVELVDPVTPA